MAIAPRILIVDDQPEIVAFLSLTFRHAGYTVRTARNGRDAIEVCSSEPLDVVLSDVVMPEVNGRELAQWIATHHPTIPTVLMSGYDPNWDQGARSTLWPLIAKPFHPQEVLSFVGQILRTSHSQQAESYV